MNSATDGGDPQSESQSMAKPQFYQMCWQISDRCLDTHVSGPSKAKSMKCKSKFLPMTGKMETEV